MGGPLKFLNESLCCKYREPKAMRNVFKVMPRVSWHVGDCWRPVTSPSTSHCLNQGLAVAAKTRSKMVSDCDDLRKGRLRFFKQLWKRVSSRAIVCNLQSVLHGRLILNGGRQRTDSYSCPFYVLQ